MPTYLFFDTNKRTFQVDIPEGGRLNRGYTEDGFSWIEVLDLNGNLEFAHTDVEIAVRVGAAVEVAHGPAEQTTEPDTDYPPVYDRPTNNYHDEDMPQPVWDPELAAQEYQDNYPRGAVDEA